MSRALLLFAHGARDARWAEPFVALRERLRARLGAGEPGVEVELAYLELMEPSLPAAVAALAARGATAITVVPVFLGTGGHLRRDLPPLIEAARAAHPGLAIEATAPIGEQPEVIEAIAGAVARLARR